MKTISQAAKEYELYSINNLSGAFQAGASFVQRWIPVSEEFPEAGEIVLMKSLASDFVGFYQDGFFFLNEVVDKTQKIIIGVTHWRPLNYEL